MPVNTVRKNRFAESVILNEAIYFTDIEGGDGYMAIKWTKTQETAIHSRGRTLLVSAAAGSGKTAVLTARIIKRLTDLQNPIDISRMLVVTFTKAAAAELRGRIQKALSDELKANPSNHALSRQAVKLGYAKICTIHSFCYDIVRSNFEQLGIGANVRVADDTEIKIIYSDVMERVINELYDAQPDSCIINDFAAFADNFITDRDERLNDIMNGIYNKVCSFPDGIGYIKKSSEYMISVSSEDFLTSRFGVIISEEIKKQLAYFIKVYSDAVSYLAGEAVYTKNYLPAFEYDLEFMNNLNRLLDKSIYSDIKTFLDSYNRPKLGSGVKKEKQTDETDFYKKVRDDFNTQRKMICDRYFSLDETQIKDNMLKTAQLCYQIYKLLCLFEEKLIAEKKSRCIVDFNDLEQMTYKLLYKDGLPTSFAREQALRYDEIYIDEYQDVNELQDKIFSAVSNDYNRFMVGDIKQSIYGFRGASPEIFSDYRDRFPKYSEKETAANTIFLSDNFRCDSSIIDFTNIVFKCLFTNNSGYVPYYDEDRLVYSKNENGHISAKVEVAIIKKVIATENDDDDNEDSNLSEAVYVVNRIRSLIKEGYRPKDITILLRSAKNDAQLFETELAKLGMPYYNGVTRDFFENAEVLLMLCVLNCIDNPTRDIYLAGALKSSLFGITLDELVQIRTYYGDGSLYDALKEYTKKFAFSKGSYFLDKLSIYRKYAEGQPVDRLIWFIYRDTAIMSLIYDNDKSGKNIRRSNLMLLYEYARRFEASSFRGLYNFIRYLNDIINERETLETAKISAESDDAVKIMTVHQSKGLEFPVCFLCGAHKKFNKSDIIPNILINRFTGIASKLRDSTGFARYDTPMRRAVALKITENNLDEEMRVLYVALTRARERLIVTASSSDPQKLINECTLAANYISQYSLSESPSYIKWILTALKSVHYENCCILQIIDGINVISEFEEKKYELPLTFAFDDKSKEEMVDIIKERFEFRYPFMYMSKIPAKISVSELYPSVLDGEDTSAGFNTINKKPNLLERPRFLETTTPAKVSSAERGTATHIFMQFCDFRKTELFGIKTEIERLVSNDFIPRSSADLININQIQMFFNGYLYSEMKKSHRLWRETRFNIKLPASEFSKDEVLKSQLADEHILVQGVIDCFFFDINDHLILVDYKTDYIPADMRDNSENAKKMLIDRHRLQLSYYKSACERITRKPVYTTYIYSFGLGTDITIDI